MRGRRQFARNERRRCVVDSCGRGEELKLILEGGGVRAAYSAGVCRGLVEGGIRFDAVMASSSGVLNAAFVAAGQTKALCELWQDLTPNRGLISWRRQFTPFARPGLDLDMLIDDILVGEGKLDLDRATAGDPALFFTATDVARVAGHVVRPTRSNLVEWLRAALAFPAGYDREVRIDGVRYVDGGVALPVAFDAPELAQYRGPSVVVLTRRATTSKPEPRWYEKAFVHLLVPKAARPAVLGQHVLHNRTMKKLESAGARGEVIVSNPPAGMPLQRFTTDARKVECGIRMGLEEGRRLARVLADSVNSDAATS
jgi:predicted patatin/cPLA2 family phospholipase